MSESFLNKCKQSIVPYISNKIISDYKNEISNFFADKTSESLRSFDVEEFLKKYSAEVRKTFNIQLNSINENLTSGDDYVKYLNKIQKEIKDGINQNYKRSCDYNPLYPSNLEESRIGILQYKEEKYRIRLNLLNSIRHKYFIEIIKISLPEPFLFHDGNYDI